MHSVPDPMCFHDPYSRGLDAVISDPLRLLLADDGQVLDFVTVIL